MAHRHGLIVQMARPAAPFALTPSDIVTLQSWLRMGSLAQNLAQRARILLLLADGLTPNTVAEQMQISASVIFKWRKRYQEAGLEGLNDLPRSGHPGPALARVSAHPPARFPVQLVLRALPPLGREDRCGHAPGTPCRREAVR